MLTKKYYVLIADAIKISKEFSENESGNADALAYLVGNLQARFNRNNPNFKEDIFKKACGF
jgi:hypothetical protein